MLTRDAIVALSGGSAIMAETVWIWLVAEMEFE